MWLLSLGYSFRKQRPVISGSRWFTTIPVHRRFHLPPASSGPAHAPSRIFWLLRSGAVKGQRYFSGSGLLIQPSVSPLRATDFPELAGSRPPSHSSPLPDDSSQGGFLAKSSGRSFSSPEPL